MIFDTEQPSYRAFRTIVAERTKRLVVWVGAGLSRPARLPMWPDLRAQLTQAARQQAAARIENAERDLAQIAAVEKIESHWTAFERLQEILGEPTFVSLIRGALAKADDADIPENYERLWRLPLWAMVTLNLDRFAARSFGELHPGKALHEVHAGFATGQYGAILQSNTPIVLNAHGVLSNRDSWVFTQSEIGRLLATESYIFFLNALIATSSILFIGISADDIASGGFLARLLQKGFSTGEHFWLTPRGDDATRAWANSAGIQPIYYSAAKDHDAPLAAFFADLQQFRSRDDVAPPVRHSGPVFPSKGINETDSPNEIRKSLAGLVDNAFEGSNPVSAIRSIAKTHELAIHSAWFVSNRAPHDEFFMYKIQRKLGEGGFGKVYLGIDPSGKEVAIKVLREEILENEDLVGSFRRGVRSMRILSDRNVDGMVPYLNAFELPPTVVMDFVNGPNLQELKQRGDLSTLDDVLKVAHRVAGIVHAGHMLPERVLHRDLRPANIMVRDYYPNADFDSVVVLDFDLSWHKGSEERSVDLGSVATMGYLAPELIARSAQVSTRSTAVDVFGLAMTIYFMLSGNHPRVGIIYSKEWEAEIGRIMRRFERDIAWKSVLTRLARLLLTGTRPDQTERPDMPSMMVELARLNGIVVNPTRTNSAELLAEELAARAGGWRAYTWDADSLSCSFRLGSGVLMVLTPDEVEGTVRLNVSYTETGQTERRGVARYVAERRAEVLSRLRAASWEHVVVQSDQASLGVEADVRAASVGANIDALASSLKSILDRLGME